MKRKPSDRFELLNNCIGYGNPHASIIHLSLLEEGSSWSVVKLLEKHRDFNEHKSDIVEILAEKNVNIEKRIQEVNRLMSIDIDDVLDTKLDRYETDKKFHKENIQYFIDGSGSTDSEFLAEEDINEICDTTRFYHEVSVQIINKLPKYKLNESDYSKNFGTERGNEVCLNLNPLARSRENNEYDEYEYFFGKLNEKSIDNRKKWIKEFILDKQALDIKPFIFIYSVRAFPKDIEFLEFRYPSFEDYEISNRKECWFKVDSQNLIWLPYHPSPRNRNLRVRLEEISDMLNPNDSKVVNKRR